MVGPLTQLHTRTHTHRECANSLRGKKRKKKPTKSLLRTHTELSAFFWARIFKELGCRESSKKAWLRGPREGGGIHQWSCIQTNCAPWLGNFSAQTQNINIAPVGKICTKCSGIFTAAHHSLALQWKKKHGEKIRKKARGRCRRRTYLCTWWFDSGL